MRVITAHSHLSWQHFSIDFDQANSFSFTIPHQCLLKSPHSLIEPFFLVPESGNYCAFNPLIFATWGYFIILPKVFITSHPLPPGLVLAAHLPQVITPGSIANSGLKASGRKCQQTPDEKP